MHISHTEYLQAIRVSRHSKQLFREAFLWCHVHRCFNPPPPPPESDNGSMHIRHPNHYLNQCWVIVNWTLMNTFQWNFNQNSYIFIQKYAFENVSCETAAICLRLNLLKQSPHRGHRVFNDYQSRYWWSSRYILQILIIWFIQIPILLSSVCQTG